MEPKEIAAAARSFSAMARVVSPDPKAVKMRRHAFHLHQSGSTTLSASAVLLPPGSLEEPLPLLDRICEAHGHTGAVALTAASLVEPFLVAEQRDSPSEELHPRLVSEARLDVLVEGEESGNIRHGNSGAPQWLSARLLAMVDVPASADSVLSLLKHDGSLIGSSSWDVGWSLADVNLKQVENDARSALESNRKNVYAESTDPLILAKSATRIALLGVSALTSNSARHINVSVMQQRGDSLLIVGSPFGILSPFHFFNSISVGAVANCLPPGAVRSSLLMADIHCLPGMEGAPVFDKNSCLVGMLMKPLRQRGSSIEVQLVITWDAICTAWSSNKLEEIGRAPSELLDDKNADSKTMGSCGVDNYRRFVSNSANDLNQYSIAPSSLRDAISSVVLVTVGDTSWASGIVLNKNGLVLTNAHLLEPWRFGRTSPLGLQNKITSFAGEHLCEGENKLLRSQQCKVSNGDAVKHEVSLFNLGVKREKRISVRLDHGERQTWCNASVVFISKGPLDVALLQMEKVPIELCAISPEFVCPTAGSSVYVVGHGLLGPRSGLCSSLSSGVVSKIVKIPSTQHSHLPTSTVEAAMFGSRVQDEVEMQRRTTNRIFPDERQDQSKLPYQAAWADRFGANRIDAKNPEKIKVLNEGNKPWHRRILDPGSSMVLTWNRVYLVSCLFALFLDPFFYYLPLVIEDEDSNLSCVAKDQSLSITITILRTLADLFYMLNIMVKFHTAYVDPKSRVLGKGELVVDLKNIQKRYLRTDFFIDLLAAIPLPQVTVWVIMPAIKSSDYNIRNTTFALVIVIQYIVRMYLIVPLSNQIIKAAGVVAKSAWGGAAYNLLLYMLASHVTGAIYYLLSIERQITCWNQLCLAELNTTSCNLGFISCENSDSIIYHDWGKQTQIFKNCSATADSPQFNYGMFLSALSKGAVSTSFHEKYFFCLWWGLLQLSSSGNPLVTSAFIVENTFAIAIGALSLILFAQLIGNMQTYLQSISKRLEEWRLRQRDMEEWMRHHQLPPDLQERVRRFVQVKWLATRGVEEEPILQALPADIRRDVQRHLCLDLVRRVRFFSEMDDQLLDAICERLVSFLCPEGTYISREGDPVNEMLFIIRGKLESSTTNGGRSNFFNSIILRPGDFAGEELLAWALLPKTNVHFPLSTRTVRSLTEVEAFVLRAEDLKFVANQFRRLHSKKLQHTFRFYSHHWRSWAACFIQAAWRQHQRRKLAESLSRWESYTWWSDDHPAANKPKQEGTLSSTRNIAEGAIAQMHKLASASRRFRADSTVIRRLQKPDEPDFSADHFD